MKRLPKVLGLMVCKRVQFDVTEKQMNLLGVSNYLRLPRSQSRAEAFTAYAALYGGKGEGTMELIIWQLETEHRFYRYQRWVAFPEAMGFIHLKFQSSIAGSRRLDAICLNSSLTGVFLPTGYSMSKGER